MNVNKAIKSQAKLKKFEAKLMPQLTDFCKSVYNTPVTILPGLSLSNDGVSFKVQGYVMGLFSASHFITWESLKEQRWYQKVSAKNMRKMVCQQVS